MNAGSSAPGAYPETTFAPPGWGAHIHPTHEEDSVSPTPRMRRALALVLAGGSLAIGVPAALAAGGGDDAATTTRSAPPTFEQVVQQQDQQQAPGRGDCPERDGGGATAPDSGASETPSL